MQNIRDVFCITFFKDLVWKKKTLTIAFTLLKAVFKYEGYMRDETS